VTFLPDGKTIASTSYDALSFWQAHTGRRIGQFERLRLDYSALSPDGKTLAVTTPDENQMIDLWDTATGKKRCALAAPLNYSQYTLVFSPDGKTLAAGRPGIRTIWFWDVATGKLIRQLPLGEGFAAGLAFSPDGKTLAVGDTDFLRPRDPKVRLLDAVKGRDLRKPFELPAPAGQVAFSADGKILAAITTGSGPLGKDPTILVWDVETGNLLGRLERATGRFALSPDGKSLLTPGETPRLWEVVTGKERGQVRGHSASAWAVAISPDGKLLASGSDDTTVLVWDALNLNGEPPPAAQLSRRELQALWADLAGADAAKAYRAIRALIAAPKQSVPFLQQHVQPIPAPDPKHLARLIADLDEDRAALREKATRELEKLGSRAWPVLRQVLAGRPSAEVRRRVERLLRQPGQLFLSAEELRAWRVIEVLEQIGTDAAVGILKRLARQGPEMSPSGLDAQAALDRLRRRP
jgi:WD40 repeat protein